MTDKVFEAFAFSGHSQNCYGLEIVKANLAKHGVTVLPFNPNSKNPVLVSLYWPEQIYDFVKWRYAQSMNGRTVVTGGNYATTSPQAILPFDAHVFLGDGELFDGSLDNPYLAKAGEARKRAIAPMISPMVYEDIQQTRRTFCEISRGCKNLCLFCQYGWLKDYREASLTDIEEVLKRAKTKSIRVFAADRFAHTRYSDIRRIMDRLGKNDTGSDITVRKILDNPDLLSLTRKVRVGVEGLSARLRAVVHKPLSDDELVTFCRMVSDAGIKTLDWYMIYGLPTERREEVEQMADLFRRLDSEMPEGSVIAIHWNCFSPSAQTPFQWAAPGQAYSELSRLMDERITKRIRIYHKPRTTSEWTMIRRTLAARGGEESKELIWAIAKNEINARKHADQILREYERRVGANLMGEWPADKPLPWDGLCVYDRTNMRRLYDQTMKREA